MFRNAVSKCTMRIVRRLAAVLFVAAAAACAKPPVKPAMVTPPGPAPTERLAEADRLVRAGCLDCLADAHRAYQSLRAIPSAANAATMGAIRSAGLIALRQRELGMVDEGYIAAARQLVASAPDLPAWIGGTLDIVAVLAGSIAGISRPPTSDVDLDRMRVRRENGAAFTALLRDFSEVDELSAYAWVSMMCAGPDARGATLMPTAEIFAAVSTFRDTPLIAFGQAACRGIDGPKLTALAAAEPRFVETAFLLGLRDLGRRKPDEADAQFERAYAWRPRWPSLTLTIANGAMSAEEFDKAERMYGETLAADPRSADAVLGKVKALTYLGKAVEAIAATDQLLGERWHVGDARYWRALNENQLSRDDQAWDDIEKAARLLINAEVPKLAGIIAYRRRQLEVALAKFIESQQRNPLDCETAFYHGIVLGDLRRWPLTTNVLREAVSCIDAAEQAAVADIAEIRASTQPPQRQARQIARREQRIAEGRRMIATSWYNTAVAYFSLAQKDEARQFAEKVAADEQFGARAKEILSRLSK